MHALKLILAKNMSDLGLLIIRVGIGLSMAGLHGWGKITGGPEKWEGLGGAMAVFGIEFAPTFWGFSAALAEFGGGLLLAAGLLTRPAAAALSFTMLVAIVKHAKADQGYTHALDLLIVFAAIAVVGAGRYSLDTKLFGGTPKAAAGEDPA